MKLSRARGFSLIEMSIVLVILGLIVGGVIEGQSLVRASQLKAVINEYRRHVQAVNSFRDKYNALPGDMINAATYWGAADGSTGSTAACKTTIGTGTATCNGNGDNMVATSTASYEVYRFWQHLANAGLIEGVYTGVAGSGSVPGTNTPTSRYQSTGWGVGWGGVSAGSATIFAGDYGHYLWSFATGNNYVFTATDAWTIDSKIDDGLPGSGMVISLKSHPAGTTENCTSMDGVAPPGDAGATYNVSGSNMDCSLEFVRAF